MKSTYTTELIIPLALFLCLTNVAAHDVGGAHAHDHDDHAGHDHSVREPKKNPNYIRETARKMKWDAWCLPCNENEAEIAKSDDIASPPVGKDLCCSPCADIEESDDVVSGGPDVPEWCKPCAPECDKEKCEEEECDEEECDEKKSTAGQCDEKSVHGCCDKKSAVVQCDGKSDRENCDKKRKGCRSVRGRSGLDFKKAKVDDCCKADSKKVTDCCRAESKKVTDCCKEGSKKVGGEEGVSSVVKDECGCDAEGGEKDENEGAASLEQESGATSTAASAIISMMCFALLV